jgi:S1-C subfamily serine protease
MTGGFIEQKRVMSMIVQFLNSGTKVQKNYCSPQGGVYSPALLSALKEGLLFVLNTYLIKIDMDEFSKVIINAVEQIKNAVVKIDVFREQGGRKMPAGSGSGFVFSSDGLIFTNAHVIANAGTIRVKLLDGSEMDTTIIGKDPDSDIAILKIYGNGYTVARLGDPQQLQIGQFLIAIGNPLGYQHSVSTGILSGTGRTLRTASGQVIENVLQTDAPLNPGNSGGPLINTDGEVVGINTAIVGGAQGLSFAIDITMAREVARQLILSGKVTKAYLGMVIQEIDIHPRIRNFHHLANAKGLYISGINADSPAKKAQIMEGDILVEFDGQVITGSSGLFKLLTAERIGKIAKVKVLRKGGLIELEVIPVEKAN